MTIPLDRPAFRHAFIAAALPLLMALFAAVPATTAARAAATGWVGSQGGKVRIIATPPTADGTIRAAVVIDLKPGWTTYWRNPGESGVPPRLDIAGSTNIRSADLMFPPPAPLDEGGVPAIGYTASVTLPLSIRQAEAGQPSVLKANLFLGMCKDICIPVSASYELAIAAASSPAGSPQAARIALAYAQLPEPESAGFGVDSVKTAPDGKSLLVEARLPGSAASPPALFLAGPPAWAFGSARLQAGDAAHAEFAVPVISAPDGASLSGKTVRIVLTNGTRSVETKATVE